ncbi:MAG: flagellin [Pseudomonadota bacterium]
MSDITLSSSVRNNLLALQDTADLLASTQERLATGLKVNSALDDPTAFFTASSLNARASDLNRLQDFVGNAVQTLRAADEGIEALTNLAEAAEATARQALQSSGTTARVTGTVTNLTTSTVFAGTSSIANNDEIIIGDGSETTTFTVTASNTVDDFLTAINGNTDSVDVRASLSGGALKFESTGTTSITLAFTEDTGTDVDIFTAFGVTDLGSGVIATAGTASSDRSSFATQFDDLRTQIDQLAADASFNGVNLLNGDSLTVTFNEDSTSSLGISGVTFDAAGLGITTADNTFQTDFDVNAAITELTAATNTLRSQSSTFGNNLSVVETRQDFTKNLINVLETGAANLTLADTNEEGANLLALQTRQQLSSTALSLASQADQNVLRLF